MLKAREVSMASGAAAGSMQAYACYLLVRNRKWQLLADAWLLWIGLQSSGALACMGRYPGKH